MTFFTFVLYTVSEHSSYGMGKSFRVRQLKRRSIRKIKKVNNGNFSLFWTEFNIN